MPQTIFSWDYLILAKLPFICWSPPWSQYWVAFEIIWSLIVLICAFLYIEISNCFKKKSFRCEFCFFYHYILCHLISFFPKECSSFNTYIYILQNLTENKDKLKYLVKIQELDKKGFTFIKTGFIFEKSEENSLFRKKGFK